MYLMSVKLMRKPALEQCDFSEKEVLIGFIWLRPGTSNRLLWTWQSVVWGCLCFRTQSDHSTLYVATLELTFGTLSAVILSTGRMRCVSASLLLADGGVTCTTTGHWASNSWLSHWISFTRRFSFCCDPVDTSSMLIPVRWANRSSSAGWEDTKLTPSPLGKSNFTWINNWNPI